MSIKKLFLSVFILLFTFLGLTSCGGGDDNGGGTDPGQPTTYSLTISSPSSGTLSFDASGGNQSISFSASSNWSLSVASTGSSWCSVSALSGTNGNKSVTITVSENTGTTERSSSVSITCGNLKKSVNITQAAPVAPSTTFVKGADISWVTEMEANGKTFKDANGSVKDCFTLMKELGLNAIRLRVWVNPIDSYCGLDDVLAKAKRAKDNGLDLMIDFHYSDSWADPDHQKIPNEWENKSLSEVSSALADHTKEVLNVLKSQGIEISWVQVGNEIRSGMVWPIGQLKWGNGEWAATGWDNLATLVNAGYDAVKEVFPKAQVLVHLDKASDQYYVGWFNRLKENGGKFDAIGLSHYPQKDDTSKRWNEMNSLAASSLAQLSATFKVPVFITEIGVQQYQPDLGFEILCDFIEQAKKVDNFVGLFYWEPEVDGKWNDYTYGAFTIDGKPTKIMDAFKD